MDTCCTTFCFHGSKEEIKSFYETITKWSAPVTWSGKTTRSDWLGNILINAGLGDTIDNPDLDKRLFCRGSIIGIGEICDNSFDIWVESAYEPYARMWQEVINKLGMSSVGFSFISDCGEEDDYQVYDPHNYGDFDYIDIHICASGDAEVLDGDYSLYEAEKALNEFFDTDHFKLEALKKICDTWAEDNDETLAIHNVVIDNCISR